MTEGGDHMKRILVLGVILLTMGCSKTIENPRFENYVDVPGMAKQDIYEGAKRWIAMNFVSAKAVIEYDDKEEGVLIGNGNYPKYSFLYGGKCDICFTMRIDVKDEKFRFIVTNLAVSYPNGGKAPLVKAKHVARVEPYMVELGESLHAYLTTGIEKEKEW
jgi:hypothetical protein